MPRKLTEKQVFAALDKVAKRFNDDLQPIIDRASELKIPLAQLMAAVTSTLLPDEKASTMKRKVKKAKA
jgi:hypothetical protein